MYSYGRKRKTLPEDNNEQFTHGREITSDDEELLKINAPPQKRNPRKSYYIEPKRIITTEKIITQKPRRSTQLNTEQKTPKYCFGRKKKIETKLDVREKEIQNDENKISEEKKTN